MSNEEREEFLSADREIPGQRFCLLSFLSPEEVLARKDHFFFERFVQSYEVQWRTKSLEAFLAKQVNDFNAKLDAEAARLDAADQGAAAEICRASRARVDEVLTNYQEYLKKNQKDINATKIKEAYDDFLFTQGEKLEDEFYAKNNFRTSVRGLKVRGTYGSYEEAAARAKKLQGVDPLFNIYVAEVGKWLPWDPKPSQVQDQEYAEDQLNTLMKAYKQNEDAREQFYAKNPEAKADAFKGKKRVLTMNREEESTAGAAGAAGAEGSATGYEGMFSAGDLALERKMERAKREAEEKKDA